VQGDGSGLESGYVYEFGGGGAGEGGGELGVVGLKRKCILVGGVMFIAIGRDPAREWDG
jgi:hypothetical protein